MVRQKLEKVDVIGDIQSFISACGTGTEKPGCAIEFFIDNHSPFCHILFYCECKCSNVECDVNVLDVLKTTHVDSTLDSVL